MADTKISALPVANNTDTLSYCGIQDSLTKEIPGAAALAQTLRDLGYTPAPINSPTFTGDPKAPTPLIGDNDTSIATTAFVKEQGYVTSLTAPVTSVAGKVGDVLLVEGDITNLVADLALKAPLANPVFTGDPQAPTPPVGDDDNSIATTAFVTTAVHNSTPYPSIFTVPKAADFLVFNGGTGTQTVTDKVDRMQVRLTTNGNSNIAGQTINLAFATPYTLDAFCITPALQGGGLFGLLLSDGTKYITFYSGVSSGVGHILIEHYNSSSSGSVTISNNNLPMGMPIWTRITDNGTNRIYYISTNGKDFQAIFSELTNTFLTPTKTGFVIFCNNTLGMVGTVQNFLQSNSILGDAP